MDAKLSVEVGAKIDELLVKMGKAEQSVIKSVTGMDVALNKADRSFKILNNTKFTFGANFQTASSKLATEATRTSAILGGSFSKGANSANAAVLELSRGIQDAPYGFTGFVNNLQQFQGLFQQLVKETGSASEAIKSLGKSLIGPAGLGVAFSVITAAYTVYTLWAAKASKETKALSEATDELANSSAKEIAKLTILYDASQNLNIPLRERRKIVDELQRQYPKTFGNLEDEAILAGKARRAYDALTQSLINAAVVRGGEDLIAEKVKGLAKTLIDFQLQQQKYSDATKGKGFLAKNTSFNVDQNGDLETLTDYEKRLKKEISDVRKSVQSLTGNFSAAEIIGNLTDTKTDKKSKILPTKRELILERDELINNIKMNILDYNYSGVFNQGKDNIREALTGGKPLISMDSILPANMAKNVARELNLINFELIEFNERASEIIQNSIVGTFDGIGDAIGEALSGGKNVIEGLSHTLLAGLGGLLVNLGKLAIATGVGIQAIKTAFKTLNPLVAIGAGVALVALGSAISKSVSKLGDSKLPGFATGVENFKGGLAIVGERGPEVVNLPQGSDVIPNHRSRGLLGGDNGGYIAETRVDLESLWIGIRKVEKRISLLGG